MKIVEIEISKLREMKGKEGLVIQGCGGDLKEWVDGINGLLSEAEIFLDENKFDNCYVFKNENCTCLLFPFEDMQLNYGRLAMWRLQTHSALGSTWLTDFVEHNLGGFYELKESTKPDCALIGENGNVYNLLGIACKTLRENGMQEEAQEMTHLVLECGSYDEALQVMGKYVNITSAEAQEETGGIAMQQ